MPRAERPEVDDVAEQIDVLGFVGAQEGKQALGLAGAGAEVYIREEDRPDPVHG